MSLIIETGRLRDKPESICGEKPASLLEIETGEVIRLEGNLAYDLTAQCVSGELIVQGTLKMDFVCLCARCGDEFSRRMKISDFCRSFPLTSKNELINLTADVREDILLALPMVAVCSAGCRGLCNVCGVNLNRANCKCKQQARTDPWRALDGLRLSRETRGLQ